MPSSVSFKYECILSWGILDTTCWQWCLRHWYWGGPTSFVLCRGLSEQRLPDAFCFFCACLCILSIERHCQQRTSYEFYKSQRLQCAIHEPRITVRICFLSISHISSLLRFSHTTSSFFLPWYRDTMYRQSEIPASTRRSVRSRLTYSVSFARRLFCFLQKLLQSLYHAWFSVRLKYGSVLINGYLHSGEHLIF